jgi:hypothetical protein
MKEYNLLKNALPLTSVPVAQLENDENFAKNGFLN